MSFLNKASLRIKVFLHQWLPPHPSGDICGICKKSIRCGENALHCNRCNIDIHHKCVDKHRHV